MAGEATHAMLADRVCDQALAKYAKPEFILGTLFPDIRYLGVTERDTTHVREITLAHVRAEEDAFIAGAKFHSLVDKVRNEFMKASGVYDQCPPFLYDQQSLKFLEDELFYSLFPSWSRVLSYLDDVAAGPEQYGVTLDAARQWYALMADYLSNPPSDASRARLGAALGFTNEAIILMNAYIEELKKKKTVTDLMMNFYRQFPSLI